MLVCALGLADELCRLRAPDAAKIAGIMVEPIPVQARAGGERAGDAVDFGSWFYHGVDMPGCGAASECGVTDAAHRATKLLNPSSGTK